MKHHYQTMQAPHLIIIGGGFAGLELIKKLNNKPIKVTVFDKHNYFNFQPLMYQVASGGLGPDAIAYPLRKIISGMPNIAFRMAEVQRVQTERNEVMTSIGTFSYDYLCIATGAQTNFFGNAELEKYSMQLKSIPDALDLRSDILQEFEKALNEPNSQTIERALNFVVVGGGPTGVETAGALAEMKKNVLPADYTELDASKMQVHLVEAAPLVLAAMSEVSSRKAKQFLEDLGVHVQVNTSVQKYDAVTGELFLSNGTVLKTDTVIWSAGVKGKTIDGISADVITRGNRYKVDAYNKIEGLSNVFAIGDIAYMETDGAFPNGHPMVATVAQQQGRLLGKNILNMVSNKPLKPYTYLNLGSMATVGRHKAVLEVFGIKMQGYIAWLGWMFLHLMLLVGFRNRVVVFLNWVWNYVSYQRAIRIITRPFVQKQ
ncbi:MAG: NAD(P)/FAD-dependent oxidoreductase [Bacteroidia bacterium]|jgi:NADH dehydrogenase|nr:NAD(P)/FAD-dependent oxidoreductase [Bacteroidia bacterium]